LLCDSSILAGPPSSQKAPRKGITGSQTLLPAYNGLWASLWVSSLAYLLQSKPAGEPRSGFRTRTGSIQLSASMSQASSDPGDILGDRAVTDLALVGRADPK